VVRIARREADGQRPIGGRSIQHHDPRHVQGGVDLAAHHRRNLGQRVELLDRLDQPQKDDFLIVGGAEESPVDCRRQRRAEAQRRAGEHDHHDLQPRRSGEDFADGAVRIRRDRVDDERGRQRHAGAQHVLREHVLDAEPDEDPESEHPVLDDGVAERDG
jgi:hypothetical protein